MSWRFFRRIRLVPHLWINLSKSGASVSIGIRGLRATFGHGRTRLTAGLPGTGLSFSRVTRHRATRQPDAQDVGRRLLERALDQRGAGD